MNGILKRFLGQFGAEAFLPKEMIIERNGEFFLLSPDLKEISEKNAWWCHAGTYLGKIRDKRFSPSFPLLFMIVEKAKNRVVVDDKSAWLFICGRDIFRQGIIQAAGSIMRGSYTLVLNRHGECLGFGRIVKNLDEASEGVVIKNMFDLGDFLRRENPAKAKSLNPSKF
ncbi:MAG: hypothetical protein N3F10_06990 [Candidatus Bathyarchaeota archaeon]|nr:hypothetical protein [Candidatus Bathyarchaeota archaeon]MCX8178018.1 hypothetical protein [Candidatus Bathyarchaeota archaeon]MDW8194525.1 hypothetical protein [Nitrososphaerota archaeon]